MNTKLPRKREVKDLSGPDQKPYAQYGISTRNLSSQHNGDPHCVVISKGWLSWFWAA